MILPDVNVLLYAFRSDSPGHRIHREWLSGVVAGDAAYGMSPQILSSVVRIATHPRIYADPDQLEDVVAFADTLLNQPHCQTLRPGSRHWSIFTNLCRTARVRGNLVQDAWFAALAIEHGCEWITADRDFGRFPGLKWRSIE